MNDPDMILHHTDNIASVMAGLIAESERLKAELTRLGRLNSDLGVELADARRERDRLRKILDNMRDGRYYEG